MDELPPEDLELDILEGLSEEDMMTLLTRLKKEHRAIDREIKALSLIHISEPTRPY